jgi:Transcription factor S-II (TFIIS), central domain
MSEIEDESDDEDWEMIEKVIQERDNEHQLTVDKTLPLPGIEEVLNIDDFFEMRDKHVSEDLSGYSFQLQMVIEDSLRSYSDRASETSSSSSSISRSEPLTEVSSVTPQKRTSQQSSSSSSRQQREVVLMKYHTSSDNFNLINSISDEVLIRMLSLADYTTQRVCRRWSLVQIKVSRLKIVETLTNVSLLKPEKAGVIESELFHFFLERLSNEYRQRARSLIFNLRGNKDLRMRVIDGSLPPSHLVRMESSETATKDLVQQREGNGSYLMKTVRIRLLRPFRDLDCLC